MVHTDETDPPAAADRRPQCSLIDDDLPRQIKALSTSVDDADVIAATLTTLPSELLQGILIFCGAGDIEDSVKRCCKILGAACRRETLWKCLCQLLGKRCDRDTSAFPASGRNNSVNPPSYRRCYLSSPCVPVDCASISEAIKRVERLRRHDVAMNHEVLLLPGVYEEDIVIKTEEFDRSQLTIRAAFADKGATVRLASPSSANTPCVRVAPSAEDTKVDTIVCLEGIRFEHSSAGCDIWTGNCGVMVSGPGTRVRVSNCKITSDTGRGLVVSTQATLELTNSTIVDCAATGLYVGDRGTRASVSCCNVVRNGFGSTGRAGGEPPVPNGHSGVYVESSMCWIEDTLLAGNSLTGLSVVRSGFVNISCSDILENGQAEPILVEDAHDAQNRLNGMETLGGVVEGPIPNNFSPTGRGAGESPHFKGGKLRETGLYSNI